MVASLSTRCHRWGSMKPETLASNRKLRVAYSWTPSPKAGVTKLLEPCVVYEVKFPALSGVADLMGASKLPFMLMYCTWYRVLRRKWRDSPGEGPVRDSYESLRSVSLASVESWSPALYVWVKVTIS